MRYELRSTKQYDKWLAKLNDHSVKLRVLARLAMIENGHFGDFKQINSDLFELRFFFSSDLRVYYTIQNEKIVFLLAGGNKSTQKKNITKVRELLAKRED